MEILYGSGVLGLNVSLKARVLELYLYLYTQHSLNLSLMVKALRIKRGRLYASHL